MQTAEYLRLHPGGSDEEVLDSILHADADRGRAPDDAPLAREQSASGTEEAYVYFFTRVPPDPALQEYAYGTLGATGDAAYTAVDLALSERMADHWARFAATGDPNGPGLPHWPSVAESPDQVMDLGEAVAHSRGRGPGRSTSGSATGDRSRDR